MIIDKQPVLDAMFYFRHGFSYKEVWQKISRGYPDKSDLEIIAILKKACSGNFHRETKQPFTSRYQES